MGIVLAPVQTVEEIYRLVWAAVANKQRIALTDWPESRRTASRALLSVRRREPERAPASWFAGKLALYGAGKAQQGEVNERCLAHSTESFAPDLVCGPKPIYRCGGSS
jgi:hypothetical protein